jgi:hypothetical protein
MLIPGLPVLHWLWAYSYLHRFNISHYDAKVNLCPIEDSWGISGYLLNRIFLRFYVSNLFTNEIFYLTYEDIMSIFVIKADEI